MSLAVCNLDKGLIAKFALERFFPCVYSLMAQLASSGMETFATECAGESVHMVVIRCMGFEL